MDIDISDLTPAAALAALYNASRPLGLGRLHFNPAPMDEAEAAEVLSVDPYVDYLKGCVIKTKFAPDAKQIESRLYDRDNGDGAAQRAIDAWRDSARKP